MGDTGARGSTRLLLLVVSACVAASVVGVAVVGVAGDGGDGAAGFVEQSPETTVSSTAPGGEVTLPTAVELERGTPSPTVDLGDPTPVPDDAPIPPPQGETAAPAVTGAPMPRSEVMTVFVDGLPFLVVEPEDRPSYAGRELQLDGALVSARGDDGFWVGEGRHRLFVSWGDAEPVSATAGDRVSGRGLMRTPPPDASELGVTDSAETEALREQRVYVHAVALTSAK